MITLQEFIAEGRGNQTIGKALQVSEEKVHALEMESMVYDDHMPKCFSHHLWSGLKKTLGHSETIGTEDWTVCNCSSKTIGPDNLRTRVSLYW